MNTRKANPRSVVNPGVRGLRKIGDTGKVGCRMCGLEILEKKRRTFCGNICVHRWRLQTQPGYSRTLCWDRDHGVCAICAVDTAKVPVEDLRRLGYHRGQSRWQADHTVPLSEGGLNTMENFRTLCVPCHRGETAALKRRLAQATAWQRVKPTGWWSSWPRNTRRQHDLQPLELLEA